MSRPPTAAAILAMPDRYPGGSLSSSGHATVNTLMLGTPVSCMPGSCQTRRPGAGADSSPAPAPGSVAARNAAVERNHGAGEVGAGARGEEDHEAGYVVGPADAT